MAEILAEKDLARKLRETLRVLVRRLGILERSEASCCGITFAQCHALVELGRAGELSVNELAELLNLDKSTASRSIDNLANNGLVLREPDPNDRRYVSVRLSERGRELFAALEARMEAYYGEVIELVPAVKRGQVVESLALLAEAVKMSKCCGIGGENSGACRKKGR